MSRSILVFVGIVALVLLGVYELLYLPGALAAGGSSYVSAAFAAKAILCFVAAAALWIGASWAPAALALLGVTFGGLVLVEALVLGIRPWLLGVALALAWVLGGFVAALLVRREEGRVRGSRGPGRGPPSPS